MRHVKLASFSVTLCLGLCASVSVRAADPKLAAALPSYLGVYAMPLESTSRGGAVTVYTPVSELRFEVSLVNEEGGETLDLPGGVAGSLEVRLRRGAADFSDLDPEWSGTDERYAFSGEDLEETGYPSLLRPDEGMKTELVIRRERQRPFTAGNYTLTLTVVPQSVLTAQELAWKGRGGVGGAVFKVRDAADLEDQKNRLTIQGSAHLRRGELQEALTAYTELERLDPADPTLCAGRAAALFQMKDYAGAAGCFDSILPGFDNDSRSLIPRLAAYTYVALGDVKKARDALALYVVTSRIDEALEEILAWAKENK